MIDVHEDRFGIGVGVDLGSPSFRVLGDRGPRVEVRGHHEVRMNKPGRLDAVLDPHREQIPDGNDHQMHLLAGEPLHIAKECRVSGIVNPLALTLALR